MPAHETLCRAAAAVETELHAIGRQIPLARRLMTVPGVGTMVALSFIATIDDTDRFRRASDVGAFVPDGSGSGVVLTTDGLLVTNNHVVEDALQERVVFADGRTYDAEVVGDDPLTDLAVLRIHADGLTPATFTDLSINQAGTGYSLTFSAVNLTSATST